MIDVAYILKTGPHAGRFIRDVFWDYVDYSGGCFGCWVWNGPLYSNGYGRFNSRGVSYLAHRLSYYLMKGICHEDLVLRHTCDNPRCVSPNHLMYGTQADNIQDAVERDRLNPAHGSKSGKAKLNEKDVVEIRKLSKKHTFKKIASVYKVSPKQISVIVNGKQWTHV